MVIACAALLVALTGTSIAAVQATVPKNSVGSAQLKSNAVVAAKIKSSSVTAAKIASNAVTAAKIASNAVTSAKVADGSLTSADFGSDQLPAQGFLRFADGPIVVPGTSATLTSLTISQTGNYLVWAKAYFTGALANTVTCRLSAAGDFDESQVSVAAGSPATMALNVGHNYTAAGTADFQCSGALPGASANFIKISAIRLASLSSSS
jgi:hypothetical protein